MMLKISLIRKVTVAGKIAAVGLLLVIGGCTDAASGNHTDKDNNSGGFYGGMTGGGVDLR